MKTKQELFIDALRGSDITIMEELLTAGASVSRSADTVGYVPMHIASEIGNIPILEWLFAHEADVNQANLHGWTPMHAASRAGHVSVLQWLIAHGADINPATIAGATPLSIAINYNEEAAEYLTKQIELQNKRKKRKIIVEEEVKGKAEDKSDDEGDGDGSDNDDNSAGDCKRNKSDSSSSADDKSYLGGEVSKEKDANDELFYNPGIFALVGIVVSYSMCNSVPFVSSALGDDSVFNILEVS